LQKASLIAVPVAPKEIVEDLNRIADKAIVLNTPEPFGAVGQFYQDFAQVSDEGVKEVMKKYCDTIYLLTKNKETQINADTTS
jgi:putative phosphoribosyl transferase